jgi:hypothetical protein
MRIMMVSKFIRRYTHFLFPHALLIVLMCFVISCGKKAPPVPPRHAPPPAVTDLAKQIEKDRLILTWTVPKGNRKAISSLAGFFIYRSKKADSAPECKDCPVLFTRIADVPIRKKGVMTYSETLEEGFRYIYKVIARSKAGLTSGDSNYVEFTH